MNENVVKRNKLLAEKVIKGLESRNMTGYYAESKEDALKKALELMPEGSSVTMGGCMSAVEIGLVDAVKNGNYNFIDRDVASAHQSEPGSVCRWRPARRGPSSRRSAFRSPASREPPAPGSGRRRR
ncbi:MAG: LUD domain-containing protein, partial [Lachnospiraceae bacterium]|nr:LUD domain-containing protein [Lachnospiraceae bacterium]